MKGVNTKMPEVPAGLHVVVVGNGMVGHKLCETLRGRDPDKRIAITVFGEEPRPAYDRVQLTQYFTAASADELLLADRDWYRDQQIDLRLGQRITALDRATKTVHTGAGERLGYDKLVLCTGSAAFVPPLPGVDKQGVFVYRTIEDLDAIKAYAKHAKRCAVLGGGLLGLEAARAVQACGLETHVVEMAPRLMPRQLDDIGGRLLKRSILALDVGVHLGKMTRKVVGTDRVEGLVFDSDDVLDVDMLVISAGIKPRDELARAAGLEVGPRGGVVVDDHLRTSDEHVFAVGEVALHKDTIYGLVAPGYEMATAVADSLTGGEGRFEGADLSAKLKLMGVDVASFGNPFADGDELHTVAYQDFVKGIYKKLIVSEDGKQLVGGMLVGDASEYGQLVHYARSGDPLPGSPESLIGIGEAPTAGGVAALPDAAQICSCNNVAKGDICSAVRNGNGTLAALKACTNAGTGCGGCVPQVTDLLHAELAAMGQAVKPRLCEHFDYTRQELFDIISIRGITRFSDLISEYGDGTGCEICKPTAASIFASVHNDMILEQHSTLQDTNDRFLANIQRTGLYSVIPRVPGGEITPEKLIRLGEIAKKFGLYTKITGGQRIDLFGARVNELPDIWEELVEAGFESGHAYAKGVRTVKSCVGSTWCRYGVQDSVGMAIRIEERYKGMRAPHKLKSAVSGCVRECAEAQSKDFGIIATDKGWNLYVCGNGGAKPRHADLLASDLDEQTLIQYIDRFLMYYIKTADKLTRTSVWVEKLEGGIDHVRSVVVDDSLGLGKELEQMATHLIETYQCEWRSVVENPELRARFRHFANSEDGDETVVHIEERRQRRPRDWQKESPLQFTGKLHLPVMQTEWVYAGKTGDFPKDGGANIQYGDSQIAIFNVASRGRWYATQNMCPHKEDMVLSRGIVGDCGGAPKVACPLHKKAFSLEDGRCLTGENFEIHTFPVKVEGDGVYVELPPAQELARAIGPTRAPGQVDAAE